MLRLVCEYNESPVREEMGLVPHGYGRERTALDKYAVAKRNLWEQGLAEFIEVFRHLN